jgi:uncharacterized membrane-anchored protein
VTRDSALSKVPAVTLTFWIVKILATTLGETGGDTVSMTMLHDRFHIDQNLSYLLGTALFGAAMIALVIWQIGAVRFRPFLYWATIIASTTLGTTLADFADRSLGIGYPGGSLLLFALVLASLALWYRAEGTVSVQSVNTPRVEAFYWITITLSQTLGTALGDWTADLIDAHTGDAGYGFEGGAVLFGAVLAVIALLYFRTRISRVGLFWAAFILTRPLGATVGDFFDKPPAKGGLDVSRPLATAILAAIIVACILVFPQRAGGHPGAADAP